MKSIGALLSLGLLLFTLAGKVTILGFWIYLATAIICQIVSLLIVVPKYPAYIDLDAARKASHSDVKTWDKVILWILAGVTFLMYGLAALDLGHLHVGQLSVWFAIPGVGLYPHFERGVRIQSERQHRVIKTGPYRFIRHPGYLGSVLFYMAFPLMSGSVLTWCGGMLGILGIVVRTSLEDKTLQQELAGYAEYAREVRYRLVPHVW